MPHHRDMFAYSSHKTADDAAVALETYYADGIVCGAERPEIRRTARGRWIVLFPDQRSCDCG